MDSDLLTIEHVAERTGLRAHTVRYDERVGLLDPIGRATSGHRRYAQQDLAWLEFLTRLRATGMPIRHMQRFADLRRHGNATGAERRALLEEHQRAVQVHSDDLQRHLEAMTTKSMDYQKMEDHS